MYQSILDLVVNAIGAVEGTVMYTTLEVFSTCACLFILCIPFIICFWLIRWFVGGHR